LLLKADARTPTILVDEFDAGSFKGAPYNFERGPSRFMRSSF
jgi:hypothetical protein